MHPSRTDEPPGALVTAKPREAGSRRIPAERLTLLLILVPTLCVLTVSARAADTTSQPASRPAGQVVEFKPGIRINYRDRQVELDGKVCLREGNLELFACSPGTREYESIVVLRSRPLHVYQALGLLGLEPGHPLHMLPNGKIEPATGQPVEILVEYESQGAPKKTPIEAWMRPAKSTAPLEQQTWVFAGSLPAENGAIAADEEGTVVAVVDFESAIIALPRHHTASNAELWLEPNTPAIPPLNTPCVLIIRPGPWRLLLDENGGLYLVGKPITLSAAAGRLRDTLRDTPDTRVELQITAGCPEPEQQRVREMLDALGIKPREITATQPAASSRPAQSGKDAPSTDNTALLRWAGARLDSANRATSSAPAKLDK